MMPVNSQIGFIFTKASHTEEQISRAIAHELGHVPIAIGTFHLWHTFSSENKYQAPQGSTTNLMDYNATSTDLYKYQWDYIHNPEFVLFRGDDEEGESQIGDDYICTMKFINEFCYAYNNQTKFTYQSDGFPYLGHSCKVEDGIYGTVTINIKVSEDIDFVPTAEELSSYSDYFEIECKDKEVDVNKLFKDLIADYERRERQYLNDLKNPNLSKESLQKWISILPQQAYSKFELSTRTLLLEQLSNMTLNEDYCSCDNMEDVAINLIKHTPNSQSGQLLKNILYSGIYEGLCFHIDGDNYLSFMAELTRKWVFSHIDALEEIKTDYKKARRFFYWNRVNSTEIGNRYITYKTDFNKGEIDVEFWAGDWVDTWGRPWEIHNDKLDAEDVILLQCKTVPECFFRNAKPGEVLIMPAFLFEAMCSKFDFDKKVDNFETTLTVASFFVGIGELGALSKTWEGANWAKKGWIIWNYTSSATNVLLSNDAVNSKIFNDFLKDYPKAKDWWNAVSDASAIYGGIASFDVSKILSLSNGFKCFESSWSLYKETLTIKDLSFEEKYYIDNVESMIQTINSQIQ